MTEAPDSGVIENVAVLDWTSLSSPDDLAGVSRIENVAMVLIPESLAGTLARIPTKNVASVVPVPDGARTKIHTGSVVMGGEALADPGAEDAVLVVTGTLALSSPVEAVTFRQVIVTGMVLAPFGSEAALGAGLTRVTGSLQYYRHVEGQRFRTMSGQSTVSGDFLANAGGDPSDILFLSGQTIITGEVTGIGFQQVVASGQLLAPRNAESLLAPVLTIEGQLVWYRGDPRVFVGRERFGRAFLELLDEPLDLILIGHVSFEDDVPPELLKEKIRDITLVGRITAPEALLPVLQLLTTEKQGTITTEQDDGGQR